MKRAFLPVVVAAMFSVLSLNAQYARADWDAALEAREAAERKAEQQRAAKKKAEHAKMIREASMKAYRTELGKEAVGKSDAEVERIYTQRRAAILQQANAVEAAVKSSGRQSKTTGDATALAQGDAAMKAMYGKSVSDIGNMTEKEREAFFKELEKKHPK